MSNFAHLHLHSQYSLLDGAIRLDELFPKLHTMNMNAVALTDHGNMFGALDFFEKAKENGIKPIFGCEVYLSEGDMNVHDASNRKTYHLVLLAKDQIGYQNLSFLVSKGYLEGFYYHPRIDKAFLRKHSKGLIGLTACLAGEVPQAFLTRGVARAEEVAKEYASIFEPNSFFLEIQPNGMVEQEQVNEAFIKMSRKLNLGLVATNDCHYLERKDARAHDCLLCIQTGKLVSDSNRLKQEVDEYYLKSIEEMEQAFYHVPHALESAATIADMCNVELDLSKTYLPQYSAPKGLSLESYLYKLAREGLKRRLEENDKLAANKKDYQDRLEHELSVIKKMGFLSYFLIVWDFINFARSKEIPVGPGRGSGAGSLVAYSLHITDIDPMRYNLLFERFLNPHRVSMPDFDIDFCMYRRDEVIEYVSQKYGHNNVGQIVTMHQLKARGVSRDVARVMGLSYAEGDKVAKLIPEAIQGKSVSIPEALSQEPRLRQLAKENPKIAELLEIATALEGLNRHAGTHAAGVVIGEKPLWEHVPCFKGQNGELVTQFSMKAVEKIGLVKFDFLGLKTLTVLDFAQKNIKRSKKEVDLQHLPMDDAQTLEMIQSGDTTGVFQMESSGFKELLKKLKPDCFEDLIAAVALYRPGPLKGGMVDDFISRKHGQKKVEYLHPWLEEILKETYGVIVYQEQVMQIASTLAGFDLGQADILRRAMGKKNPEEMAEQKASFLDGAKKKKVDPKIAAQVFDLMEAFAGYGFNKSHSAAYALISYQTAYLKCHFSAEFMAAVLTCEKDNADSLSKFVSAARNMNIEVLRPDINESESDFSVTQNAKAIRFGLGAIRNVGEGAADAILEARPKGPFTGLFDFCERVDSRRVNRRVIESLIKSGAFDNCAEKKGIHRAQMMGALDAAQERAATAQRDRESGQTNLFELMSGPQESASQETYDKYPGMPEWEPKQQLAFEKESLGFYVSGHPLDRYLDDLKRHASATIADLHTLPENSEVTVGGMVSEYRERPLRSGKGRMALFTLEDQAGQVEVVVFSKPFEEFESILKSDEPLMITTRLVFEGDSDNLVPRLHLKSAITLPALREKKVRAMHIYLDASHADLEKVNQLKEILLQHVGECETHVWLKIPDRSTTQLTLSERFSVAPADELLLKIERLFGERVAVFK